MSKLKIELYNIKNILLGRVLEQDEELRNEMNLNNKDGWEIKSCNDPSLDIAANVLFVRGSIKQHDNNWFSGEFGTEQEALEIAQLLKEMVDEINGVEKQDDIKLNKII